MKILYGKPRARFVPISWLIRITEGSIRNPMKGSHIAILFNPGLPIGGVFDSVAPKSRVITYLRWLEHYELIKEWEFELSEGNLVPSLQWILENTDKDYSRFQCVMIGIGEFFGGWIQKLIRKQNPNGSEYLICVEAASRFATEFLGLKFSSGPDVLGLKEFVDTLDQYTEK